MSRGGSHTTGTGSGYGAAVRSSRRCSRNGCGQPPVATLTYVYADSTAVVGPLSARPEPHTYDLCQAHAMTLTAPRGWHLVRHEGEFPPPAEDDDLVAIVEAVREHGVPPEVPPPPPPRPGRPAPHGRPSPRPRRGHLRPLPPPS